MIARADQVNGQSELVELTADEAAKEVALREVLPGLSPKAQEVVIGMARSALFTSATVQKIKDNRDAVENAIHQGSQAARSSTDLNTQQVDPAFVEFADAAHGIEAANMSAEKERKAQKKKAEKSEQSPDVLGIALRDIGLPGIAVEEVSPGNRISPAALPDGVGTRPQGVSVASMAAFVAKLAKNN